MSPRAEERRRLFAVWILPLSGLAAALAVPLALGGRLPEQVATHWDFRGNPNGSHSLPMLLAIVGAIWLLLWCGGLVQEKGIISFPGVSRDQGPTARFVAAYSGFGLLAASVGTIVAANLDKPHWRVVHIRMTSLLVLAAAAAVGPGIGLLLSHGMSRE